MARLKLWNPQKTQTYHYVDKVISEFFGVSGTALYVHLYLGVREPDGTVKDGGISAIQDVVFLENRDRKYSEEIIEMAGLYNVADADFDLRQFGFFLQGDTIFIEIHFNDMVAMCGRKIMQGDVIELPHRRDDATMGGGAINRFYTVDDAQYASSGYSSTWFSHIWRIKCVPMQAGQEYQDILDKEATDPFGFPTGSVLEDLLTTIGKETEVNDQIIEKATSNFLRRNYETQQFYVVEGTELAGGYPWIFSGDGIPPNGAALLGTGNRFPVDAAVGEYFLRIDYDPPTLFRKTEKSWRIQEVNYRHQEWNAASRLLTDFLNNQNTIDLPNGDVMPSKQAASKAAKPKADF